MEEKNYFSWCAANIWARLNKIWQKRKKIIKHSLCSFEKKKDSRLFSHFPQLYLHFADFLRPGKWLGNARLFQEFKTLYEPLSLNQSSECKGGICDNLTQANAQNSLKILKQVFFTMLNLTLSNSSERYHYFWVIWQLICLWAVS